MSVKLTTGVNFTNTFTLSFYARRSRKRKNTDNLTVFFTHLGSSRVKAVCRKLMKLTPSVNSSTFYEQIFLKCLFGSFSLVTCKQKKMPKRLLYVIFALKMSVKLTTECNNCAPSPSKVINLSAKEYLLNKRNENFKNEGRYEYLFNKRNEIKCFNLVGTCLRSLLLTLVLFNHKNLHTQ